MMRKIVILLLVASMIAFAGKITDFVPPDYDFIIYVANPSENYQKLKDVPLFSFALGEKGLGVEYIFNSMMDEVEKKSGVSKDVFMKAISHDFIISSKGISVDLNSLTSLDLNYYMDLLKNLGSNTIIALKSSSPSDFMKFMSTLLDLKLSEESSGLYTMRDSHVTIFARSIDDYVIMSGSKGSLSSALANYSKPAGGLTEEASSILSKKGFIKGYFRGNSLKIDMGVKVKGDITTDHLELLVKVENGKLVLRVDQFVKGNLEKPKAYLVGSSDMGEIPFMGNYFVGISAKSSAEAVEKVTSWFSGKGGEIKKVSDIVSSVVKGAQGKIYIIGDISAASNVTFAAVFKESKENFKDIEKTLEKYGAESEENGWILDIGGEKLHFFTYGGRFVVSNISREKYAAYSRRKKLLDDPTFNYLSSFIPYKRDISRAYLDLGNVLKNVTGLDVSSKMLFFQTYETGRFLYILEVM